MGSFVSVSIILAVFVCVYLYGMFQLRARALIRNFTPLEKIKYEWVKAKAGSIKEAKVAEMWDKVVIQEINNAHTLEKIEEALHLMEYDSYELLLGREYCGSRLSECVRNIYHQKWDAIVLEMTNDAKTLTEMTTVFKQSRNGSPAQKIAREKWDMFSLSEVLHAKDHEELRLAQWRARKGSLAKKFVQFMHEEIANADLVHSGKDSNDVASIIKVCEDAPNRSFSRETVLYKSFVKLLRMSHSGVI